MRRGRHEQTLGRNHECETYKLAEALGSVFDLLCRLVAVRADRLGRVGEIFDLILERPSHEAHQLPLSVVFRKWGSLVTLLERFVLRLELFEVRLVLHPVSARSWVTTRAGERTLDPFQSALT